MLQNGRTTMDCHLARRGASEAPLASFSIAYCMWISCGRLFQVWNSLAFCKEQSRSGSALQGPAINHSKCIPGRRAICNVRLMQSQPDTSATLKLSTSRFFQLRQSNRDPRCRP